MALAISIFIQDGILMARDAPDIGYVRHTCSASAVRQAAGFHGYF